MIPWINNAFIRDADVIVANHRPTAAPTFALSAPKGDNYFIRDIEQWAAYYPQEKEAFALDMKRLVVAP